jgi:hypothetical protein
MHVLPKHLCFDYNFRLHKVIYLAGTPFGHPFVVETECWRSRLLEPAGNRHGSEDLWQRSLGLELAARMPVALECYQHIDSS